MYARRTLAKLPVFFGYCASLGRNRVPSCAKVGAQQRLGQDTNFVRGSVTLLAMQGITHLFLDFFGTLVDYSPSRTEQDYAETYALLEQNGLTQTYSEFLTRWDGTFARFEQTSEESLVEFSMDQVCAEYLRRSITAEVTPELCDEFRDSFLKAWNHSVTYLTGVPELLHALRERYCLVLVTNTHHAKLVREHLERMGVATLFSEVVTSVEFGKKKPALEIFDHALSRTRAAKETSLFVGDSYVADYQGARNAGLRCLLVDPTERFDIPQSARLNGILDLRTRLL